MSEQKPADRSKPFRSSRVTDRELLEQGERLHLALQATGLGTWEMDLVHGRRTWSNETRAMHGLGAQVSVSDHVELNDRIVHPGDRVRLRALHDELRAGRNDYLFEYRTILPDDSERWIMARGKVMERDARGPTRIVGVCIDMTEQKHAQEVKLIHENQFRFLANSMPQLVWIADGAGRVTYFNDRLQIYAQAPRAGGKAAIVMEPLVHPDDAPATLDAWQLAQKEARNYEMEHRLQRVDGQFAWHLSRACPVKSENGNVIAWFGTATDIDKLKQADISTARMAAVAAASHDALYGARLDGTIEAWNPGAEALFGYSEAEAIGQHITMLADPRHHAEQLLFLNRVGKGEVIHPFDTIRRTKDGRLLNVSVSMSPVRAPDDGIIAVSVALHDISERKEWDERQRLMNRELAHRVKNSFAVLQAILRSTLKSSPDPAKFAVAFSGRLHSLAAAHDVLTASEWRGAELGELLRHQLSHYVSGQRIRLTGAPLNLAAEQAAPFSLIINELATNAAKYGALSVPHGVIDVGWRTDRHGMDASDLVFSWRESGGPEIKSVGSRGFGSTLIERSLAGAQVAMDFDSTGLHCTISFALPDAASSEEVANFAL